MSSNSENATRSNNKRRRSANNNNDSDASSHKKRSTHRPPARVTRRPSDRNSRRSPAKVSFEDPAPPVDDPHKLLGSRLEPIMRDLVSQPNELQITIIDQLNSMLNLCNATQQHKESQLRFEKPIPVPPAATDDQDESRAPQGFIPNSVRLKNPINSSKNYKDDERIRKEEEETQREHEEWQAKMAARAKNARSWKSISESRI